MPNIHLRKATMEKLIALLNARRGKWPKIAEDAGVDYSTLCRIVSGTTKHPEYSTVVKLHEAARKVRPSRV